jgi:type II secretory pathway component GspD/PulD (secretin)
MIVPSITNTTVNLGSMGDLPAAQRLAAILNIHDLAMVFDPGSQTYTVTYKEPGAREPLIPNVVQLRYSNTTNIQDMIGMTFPTARVRADTRTASLLVMSTQKDFDAITNLIAKLDTPTRQVLIEARFLETLQNPKSLKGIDWSGTLAANQITFGNGVSQGDISAANPFQIGSRNSSTVNSPSTTSTTTTTAPNGRPGTTVTTTSGGVTTSGSSGSTVINTLDPQNPGLTLNPASP